MGRTYYAFNIDKRERISPMNGCKAWEIIANWPGLCEVVMHQMLTDWEDNHVVMVDDPGQFSMQCFKDITAQAINDYNEQFIGCWLRYAFAGHPESFADHFIFCNGDSKIIGPFLDRMAESANYLEYEFDKYERRLSQ